MKRYLLDSACAKAGTPLVVCIGRVRILMPATGQSQRVMKFAGLRVAVSGKLFEKGGSHALAVEKIEAEAAAK